jgi:hypothetical protein
MNSNLVEVQLTLIERFIALPAPQNRLHISFVHFELPVAITGVVKWNAFMRFAAFVSYIICQPPGGTFCTCAASLNTLAGFRIEMIKVDFTN